MTVTTTTTPRPTTSKRPERGIWQSNRLSARKSEQPAQLEPPQSPTEKLHDRLGRTDQPSRSSSESPVRQEPSREEGQQTDTLSKAGPYKISFWWAPPSNPTPTPRSSAETNSSTKVASNHESPLKPEPPSSPTPTTKPDYVASRTSERNQGNSSKPEPVNVMKSDPSPTPKSSSPVDPFASEQNWGDSSPVYDIVCEFSSVPPSPESNRPSASPQPHHPRKQSPSPEPKSPMSSTQPHHPVIRPSSPESPTISIGEISHSSSSSSEHRSAAANRTLISPLSLNFVHPLPPKPTPPKPLPPSKPLLDSLQASNPYSNLFSSSTSSSPKPSQDSPDSRKDMPSMTSQPPKPVLDSALQALNPSSTMLSSSTPPKSPIAEYKFSGRLRPPPATSNPGDAYSLISRSGVDEKNGSSLLSIGAQMGLFAWIRQELTAVRKLSDSRDENDEKTEIERINRLQYLVDTIRKLREGVRAANKLDAFAVEVYELSVSTCLMKPLHREELHRSLRVLCDVLYPSVPSCKNKLRYLSVDLLWRLQGEEDDIASAHCRLSEAIKTDGEGAEGQRAVAEAVVDIRVALALGDYVGFRVGCKALQGLELGVLVKNLLPRFRHQTLDALKKAYIFIPMQKLAGYMLLDPEQHVPFYMSAEDCPRWQRLVDYLIEHGIKEEQIRGDVVHMKENSLSRT